jgi:putative ABC transport system permease protein
MDFRETLRVALKAIRRNKVRSILTMLGVIIGVASVIAMIALGSGARASIDEQIESQGTTLIYLSSGSWNRGGGWAGSFVAVRRIASGSPLFGRTIAGRLPERV